VLIGLIMSAIYRKEEEERAGAGPMVAPDAGDGRALWQDGLYFASMVAFLVFANWGKPAEGSTGLWAWVYSVKWYVAGASVLALIGTILAWFKRDELREWVDQSWFFAKQILPLLFAGVLAAGFLLGGPERGGGVIPRAWVGGLVGGNSPQANLFASVAGALMYFATLTEVPILQGLIASGMGKGPALALLLAGPALSLPNMLVIRSVLGTQKTLVYVSLVVVFSTIAGLAYGAVFS
jgi:uncharacterized membrane protein YraQ (UPF0718 family)